ncbi:GNAT family N-acetyltransferase [Ahrensia marina]|uniref:GNAT family N-acetyltransferase n=1 Tax=Ahrensia marina TaxID=1514904 RepID=UPI0035CFAD55
MSPSPRIRPAEPSDAPTLAKLIDIAGEGIPRWLWSRSSSDRQDPLDVGAERAHRTEGGFSYRNALVAERDGRPIGMVLSYAIDTAPDDDPDDLPAPIAPFVELEAQSVGTWYVNALAVSAGWRGAGVGSALMQAAEDLALKAGYGSMSIQVYSQNAGAVQLYQRLGYRDHARARVREHPCQPYYDEDVLLLLKPLNS